jgi:hypothetical protein
MALKIIGAGYPRTGTSSLKLALEQLGFGPCHHMREIIMNPSSAGLWVRAAEGHPDWEAIFDGYSSCTDAPACTFWRELVDYYPSAKVILSVRDPEAWFESTQATVFSEKMLGMQRGGPLQAFFDKVVSIEFGEHIHDRDFMLAQFERRRREVIEAIPGDKLLVYDVREGWGPLCAFLGVPVPETPFPHSNSREEMAAMMAAVSVGGPDGPVDFERLMQTARARFGPQ